MTIRVTDVHLANVPAMLVGECGGHALSVDFVDVVHPNRHPHAVIGLLRLASFRNVVVLGPLPRPPWAPWQRKISDSPAPTAPKIGGVPQSQHFFQPHFLNQAKLAAMSDVQNWRDGFNVHLARDNKRPNRK